MATIRSDAQLWKDAEAIWRAGVEAVDSRRLVFENLHFAHDHVEVAGHEIPFTANSRLIVVGAGKAGVGMVRGLVDAVPESWRGRVTGWVNVPDDCLVDPTFSDSHGGGDIGASPQETCGSICLHGARPAGHNEPTTRGQYGAERMLELVAGAKPEDIVLCLISGGGSALTPAPVPGVSLADKQQLTKALSAAGANIQQLNTVRKHLSRIKGGRLAAACNAAVMVSLIISDVLGDPLDVIASGMTIPDTTTADDALRVMEKFGLSELPVHANVVAALRQAPPHSPPLTTWSLPLVIGNNAVAVDAAGMEAERRGYSHAMQSATRCEGEAEDVGRHLAAMARRMREQDGPDCLISGGEPVVTLAAAESRGKGGRNQQLCLAALIELGDDVGGICLLSGGTDGEDGPTDAAGAKITADIAANLAESGLDAGDFLKRNDAYHFFDRVGGLLKTGPTHTNVCDLRVVVVNRREDR